MNTFDKGGFLSRSMTKFRLKFAIICMIYIVLFAMFTNSCSDYLLTRALGPTELDVERFSAECGSMTLLPDYTYDETSPDARIFGYATPEKSYLQDRSYRFDVKIEDIIPADFAFTIGGERVTPETDTEEDPIAIKADYAVIGGKKVILLIPSNQDVLPGDTVTGIFTQPSPIILSELAPGQGEGGMELCPYMLDIRGIEMSSEFSDTLLWTVFLIILLILLVKLAIYYIRPSKHPMFTQLDKYGDMYAVAEDIENELKSPEAQYYKKEIYTPEWILTRQTFKYKIGKNHISGGKFRYTPNNQ